MPTAFDKTDVGTLLRLAKQGQNARKVIKGVVSELCEIIRDQQGVTTRVNQLALRLGTLTGDKTGQTQVNQAKLAVAKGGTNQNFRRRKRTKRSPRGKASAGPRTIDYIVEAFRKSNGPLSVTDLYRQMTDAGYTTTSKDPVAMLKVYLSKEPKRFFAQGSNIYQMGG